MLPTAAVESIISTFMIDAYEGRYVGVFDILGAYLHAPMRHDKRRAIKVLRNEFLDLICKVDEKYKKYMGIVNGRKVLYLKVLRVIYGWIKSTLLWYELFSTTLKKMGFVINEVNKCVANKLI